VADVASIIWSVLVSLGVWRIWKRFIEPWPSRNGLWLPLAEISGGTVGGSVAGANDASMVAIVISVALPVTTVLVLFLTSTMRQLRARRRGEQ
jgi:hypothetical protein